MNKSLDILSDIAIYTKYARYIPELKRRETWEEAVYRRIQMDVQKFPNLEKEIYEAYSVVLNKEGLPSMRSIQFAGKPIELNNARMYNCCALPVDSIESFSETMFLLLSGCGVGYSVQQHDICKLPDLLGPSKKTRRYLIGDSIIGWADAIKALMKSYFLNKPLPLFDYSDIRPKGALLVTSGGSAPGPAPLKAGLINVQKVLDAAIAERGSGTKLTSLEINDIMCYIADTVLSGGLRRASCICLFSIDDKEMFESKFGDWWDKQPQRARANNSVYMIRHKAKKEDFYYIWDRIKARKTGDPGIYWSNDKYSLVNPCNEASLDPYSFCNLTTVNGSNIINQEDFNNRVRKVAFIGTLQASYTDFHYLRSIWKETTEKNSLLGVSITGIASGELDKINLEEAAKVAVEENKRVAKLIGIRSAKRVTLIKPEGTASIVLKTSSGIHDWYAPYYIRRMRFNKNEAIYKYFKENIPELVEDDFFKPTTDAVVSIPVKAPDGAQVTKTSTALSILERIKRFHTEWIKPGHIKGDNTHNVSATVFIKDDEWDKVGEWLWDNRYHYNGVALFKYDSNEYIQAPFEEITKEKFEEMYKHLKDIDLSQIVEDVNTVDHKQIIACAGGKCEI